MCNLGLLRRTEPNARSSIAASLIQGVYFLEQDRQQKRVDHHERLAPIWWKFFDFQLIEMLTDNADSSIFGAIFKYQPHTFDESRPPKYVIAFRGIIMEPDTRSQDLLIGMKLILNALALDPRYKTSLEYVQNITAQVGPENVWLAGHSLGAAIALQIGKTMAGQGLLIDAYLFNPPDLSVLSDMLTNPMILTPLFMPFGGLVSNSVASGLSVLLKGTTNNTQQNDPFVKLCEWKPYLFVNQNDPICSGYIGYFEHREATKKWGLIGVLSIAAKVTFGSFGSAVYGRDGDAPHLIPTAQLIKNVHPMTVEFKLAHGIRQWWASDLNLESVTYKFDNT
ncbi:GDSL esterase/lipase At4g10955-like [Silene latifolia]|uniref:GDSL esterase/lipase At4g10955-like n=1 Tax=Silene latifolia TaxID=37657 RepID=UPI003D77CEC7